MAQYVRFEIYIPVIFIVRTEGGNGKLPGQRRHALDETLLREFISAAVDKYHGLTQANPLAPALYKGWWRSKPGASVEIDYLTYLFGLVRIDEADEATAFFAEWKERFEKSLEQNVILLIFLSGANHRRFPLILRPYCGIFYGRLFRPQRRCRIIADCQCQLFKGMCLGMHVIQSRGRRRRSCPAAAISHAPQRGGQRSQNAMDEARLLPSR
jgi:hypothetical protein